jgi:hypothetical protein
VSAEERATLRWIAVVPAAVGGALFGRLMAYTLSFAMDWPFPPPRHNGFSASMACLSILFARRVSSVLELKLLRYVQAFSACLGHRRGFFWGRAYRPSRQSVTIDIWGSERIVRLCRRKMIMS